MTPGAWLDRIGSGQDSLTIGGHDAEALAQRFGTPLYVYDAALARQSARRVRSAFGSATVAYSLKANPNVALAAVLRAEGCEVEVASAGELLVARAAGWTGAQMQLAGPVKTAIDRATAAELGVRTVSVEGPDDLSIDAPELLLRADLPPIGPRPRLGHTGKFGLDEPSLLALARVAGPRLTGLHANAGTQAFDADGWAMGAERLIALADRVTEAIGRPLARINFGGGFGVAYHPQDREFDLQHAGDRLQELLRGRPYRATIELGRALVAGCGVYLTRVMSVKDTHGQRFALVDGGMHHHAAATGAGSVLRQPFPIVRAADPRASAGPPIRVAGPLCTSADEFVCDGLPLLAAGDLVAVLAAGAYGLTFSPTAFLGHPTPAEVLVDGPRADLVRERGTPADALRGQRVP